FSRRIHRKMFKPTIDSQFRMTITDNMKKLCKGIENAVEIVFGGEGDYLEVWPAHVYDKRYGDEEEDDFDTMIAILRAKLNK
ncbi:MAG: hypothetical protein K2M36_00310, partial [Clostridia bacterium]|nr:hypothetical protein [Clostridia bacterium]